MSNIVWKYVSPLKDENAIKKIEEKYCFAIPEDLKECIIHNNAGVPSVSTFDLEAKKGMVLGGLLSYNKGDLDSIYDYIDLFECSECKKLKMLPFALDPAGNFICIKDNAIVFYDHETDKTQKISNSFTDFLKSLY